VLAKADPDGDSIIAHSSALTIAPAIFPNLTYDATKDLASVLMIGSSANVMIVPNSRPWKTVQDLIADAKAKPGSISFGSVGIGSAVHISSQKFRFAAGVEATHVPYRGGSEVIADILGARIDFYFCPLATALPLIREGQVHALLVSTPKRVPDLPEVPTPIEAGSKDADSAIWLGVFMPSKTSRDIVEKFHAAGVKVLTEPAMHAGQPEEARRRNPADDAVGNGRSRQARDGCQHGTDQGRRDQAVARFQAKACPDLIRGGYRFARRKRRQIEIQSFGAARTKAPSTVEKAPRLIR